MDTKPADIDDLTASIADDASAPTMSALPSLTGAEQENAGTGVKEDTNNTGAEVDSSGVAWDASKHAPGKTKKKDGTWRAKTGVKASGSATGAPILPGQPQAAPPPPPHLSDAQALVALVTGTAQGFFGADWALRDEFERTHMVEGFRTTMEYYGGFKMPGWAAAAIALASYAGSRVHLPATKTRLAALGEKVAAVWKGIRAKFARKVEKPTSATTPSPDAKPVAASALPAGAEIGFKPDDRKI